MLQVERRPHKFYEFIQIKESLLIIERFAYTGLLHTYAMHIPPQLIEDLSDKLLIQNRHTLEKNCLTEKPPPQR